MPATERSGWVLIGAAPLLAVDAFLDLVGVGTWRGPLRALAAQWPFPGAVEVGAWVALIAALLIVLLLPRLLTRWLRRRRGWCEIGRAQVLFRPVSVLPWCLVVAKRDLRRRSVTRYGVWVEVDGAGGFLIPAAGEPEQARVIALLDDHDAAPTGAVDARVPITGCPRRLVLLGAVSAAVPICTAVWQFGLAWLLPSVVAVLVIGLAGLLLLRRCSGALFAAPRALARTSLACAALAVLTTWGATRGVPIYGQVSFVDGLGNEATVVARLGQHDHFVLLAPSTARVKLDGTGPWRVRCGDGGVWVELPADTRVAVVVPEPSGGARIETSARGPGIGILPWILAPGVSELPDLFGRVTAASRVDPVWDRYLSGETSRCFTRLGQQGGEALGWVAEYGRVTFVVLLDLGGERARWPGIVFDGERVRLRDEENKHRVRGDDYWKSGRFDGDTARLLWLGQRAHAPAPYYLWFPGEPPTLAALEAVRRATESGAALVSARSCLPFWDLPAEQGVSRGVQRRLMSDLYQLSGWIRNAPDPVPGYDLSSLDTQALEASGHLPLEPGGADLLETLRRRRAFLALSVTGLSEVLRSPEARARRDVLVGLERSALASGLRCLWHWRLPQDTRLAVEGALDDRDPEVRAGAIRVLLQTLPLEPPSADQLAVLARAFRDPSEQVRLAALEGIANEGEANSGILSREDLLIRLRLAVPLLKDGSAQVRAEAARALEERLRGSTFPPDPAEDTPRSLSAFAELLLRLDAKTPRSLRLAAIEALLALEPTDDEKAAVERDLEREGHPEVLAALRAADCCRARGCTERRPSSLCHLSRTQAPGGRWASQAPGLDAAVTGLCMLSYLSDGHTHRFGTHKAAVRSAVDWLLSRVQADGAIDLDPQVPGSLLNQALGTWALCESYAVSRAFSLREPAQRAVARLLREANDDGGWGDNGRGSASSLLATGYAVLALKGAKTAGLEVPAATFEAARNYLARAMAGDGAEPVGFAPFSDDEARGLPLREAVGTIGRILCGQSRRELQAPAARLVAPDLSQGAPTYWHFATYSQFQMASLGAWSSWHGSSLQYEHAQAPLDDPEHGSWRPMGLWGAIGGRAGTTAELVLVRGLHLRYERARAR